MKVSAPTLALWLVGLFVIAMSLVFSLLLGAVPINAHFIRQCWQGSLSPEWQTILWHLRLPRACMAFCAGACLAVAGAASQGLFRNPLADPSLLGVTAGASAGASIMILLAHTSSWVWMGLPTITLGAFLGALGALFVVYTLGRRWAQHSMSNLLLIGLAFTFFMGAFNGLLEFMVDNERLRRISLWRMGSLQGVDWLQVSIMAGVMILTVGSLIKMAPSLNTLLLGPENAHYLGVFVRRIEARTLLIIALSVGVAVALVGSIAFLGLILPQAVRLWKGPNYLTLLPLTALGGGICLVWADIFARLIMAPTEIPVGLVLALLGAPVFMLMVMRQTQRLARLN